MPDLPAQQGVPGERPVQALPGQVDGVALGHGSDRSDVRASPRSMDPQRAGPGLRSAVRIHSAPVGVVIALWIQSAPGVRRRLVASERTRGARMRSDLLLQFAALLVTGFALTAAEPGVLLGVVGAALWALGLSRH